MIYLNHKQLQMCGPSWGHVGYYRRFIQKYDILVGPLTNLLKKDQELVWTKDLHQDLHEPQYWLLQIEKRVSSLCECFQLCDW